MNRYFTHTGLLFALAAIFLTSCGDDSEPYDLITVAERHFTTESATFEAGSDTSLPRLAITLSESETAGESVSMVLVFDAQANGNGYITMPSGEYTFSVQDNSDKIILNSDKSKFTNVNSQGVAAEERITGGSVSISESYGKYVFTGNLTGTMTQNYEFTYSGRFEIRDPDHTGPGSGVKPVFDSYTLSYDNKLIKEGIYTHYLKLTNEAGDGFSTEFFSEPFANYSYMGNDTYRLADVIDMGDPGTLNNSDYTYFYSADDDRTYIFTELTVTARYMESDGYHLVSAKGLLETGEEFETEFETEQGSLCATKVYITLTEMSFYVLGQINNYTSYQYYFMLDNGIEDGIPGEDIMLFPQGTINRYHQYLPVPTGTYTTPTPGEGWDGDRDSFKPFRLVTDTSLSENGIRFIDAYGEEMWLLIETGDDSYLDIKCDEFAGGYSFVMEGFFNTFKADGSIIGDRDPEWPATEVYFSYTGIVERADFHHRHTHPWSTAATSMDYTNYFTEGMYWRAGADYWDWWGAPTGTDYVLITLKNDNGDWYAWTDDDGSSNIYYMHIGLNIPQSTPDDEIPTGTYTCDDTWTFQPGTFMQGSRWGWDNLFNCTMIFNESLTSDYPFGYGKDGGSITVEKDDNEYTITWSGYDDRGPNATKLTGKYVGEIWLEDDVLGYAIMNRQAPVHPKHGANMQKTRRVTPN